MKIFFTASGMQDEAACLQYPFPNFNSAVIERLWLFYSIYLIMTALISIFCLFFSCVLYSVRGNYAHGGLGLGDSSCVNEADAVLSVQAVVSLSTCSQQVQTPPPLSKLYL